MNVIEVRELVKNFGAFTAVDHVSFDVFEGEIFGYLGANGAGKSTTIRMLCGLLTPSEGQAHVGGIDIVKKPEQVKSVIGYMSQKFSLYPDLQVIENIEFFSGMYGLGRKRFHHRSEQLLEEMGLQQVRREKTQDLPGGFRQRLALACAILHEPKILFLDEPTAGVDPSARRDFWRLVRSLAAQGTTILVTTHYMDEAEYCDRVGLMVDGRLAALDTPSQLKRQFVPDTIFEIHDVSSETLQDALTDLSWVRNIEVFGAAWHVRMAKEVTATEAKDVLIERGIPARNIDTVLPTLEDVFLEVVGSSS